MPRSTTHLGREADREGRFVRQQSRFRDVARERPAPGRFHLYVSRACPWAQRSMIVRELRDLGDLLPMTVVDPLRDDRGWRFAAGEPDPVHGWTFLGEAYRRSDPSFDDRVSVPVLWDLERDRILNNESGDVLRMLNGWGETGPDLYPEDLRAEIDEVEDRVYETVNDGVYRAGFATTQAAYEEAFDPLFETLAWLDERLADRRYLMGDRLTEADVRLYTTLVRFDAVYYLHFKCNLRRIADHRHLPGYLRDLFQTPGFGSTTDFADIKAHYYRTHPHLNPSGIVPKGPELDLEAPHGRG